MFALAALIVFILALFGVQLGSINMLLLGLVFISAHLLLDAWLSPAPWMRRRN